MTDSKEFMVLFFFTLPLAFVPRKGMSRAMGTWAETETGERGGFWINFFRGIQFWAVFIIKKIKINVYVYVCMYVCKYTRCDVFVNNAYVIKYVYENCYPRIWSRGVLCYFKWNDLCVWFYLIHFINVCIYILTTNIHMFV